MTAPRPKSRLAPAMILVVAVLLPTAYVLGYVFDSDLMLGIPKKRCRHFDAKWKCMVYGPAAWAEAKVFKTCVSTSALLSPSDVFPGEYAVYGENPVSKWPSAPLGGPLGGGGGISASK